MAEPQNRLVSYASGYSWRQNDSRGHSHTHDPIRARKCQSTTGTDDIRDNVLLD